VYAGRNVQTQDCVLKKNWASWKQKCTEDGHTENVGNPATVNGPFGVALLVLAGSGCTFGFYLAVRNMQRERMASGEDRTFQQRRNLQTPSQVCVRVLATTKVCVGAEIK
jgi:hypothetical protein